jgi:hypothetical protein
VAYLIASALRHGGAAPPAVRVGSLGCRRLVLQGAPPFAAVASAHSRRGCRSLRLRSWFLRQFLVGLCGGGHARRLPVCATLCVRYGSGAVPARRASSSPPPALLSWPPPLSLSSSSSSWRGDVGVGGGVGVGCWVGLCCCCCVVVLFVVGVRAAAGRAQVGEVWVAMPLAPSCVGRRVGSHVCASVQLAVMKPTGWGSFFSLLWLVSGIGQVCRERSDDTRLRGCCLRCVGAGFDTQWRVMFPAVSHCDGESNSTTCSVQGP